MNAAHRLADGFRAVVSYWTPAPTTSQFVAKGTLTPQEFVEAGDQLVFKFPTWRWQSAESRRRVSWLPLDKQYLVTYGVSCRSRLRDLDASIAQSTAVSVDSTSPWYLPQSADDNAEDPAVIPDVLCSTNGTPTTPSIVAAVHSSGVSPMPPQSNKDATTSIHPDVVCFDDLDDMLENDDNVVAHHEETATDADASAVRTKGEANDLCVTRTRSYDLSVTYDKYYQTPRLWLKGYDEQGLPLDAQQIFEDILTDYISKTVTIDPHPCTGELTVSIHPCRHAAMMKKVVDGWIARNIAPRHDLALIVLLKFISSVIPTIQYDTTLDIDGFGGSLSPSTFLSSPASKEKGF